MPPKQHNVPFKNVPFKDVSRETLQNFNAKQNVPFKDVPFKDVPFKDVPLENVPFKDVPFKDVSRETLQKFTIYCRLLVKWQKVMNLVSNSSMANIWQRHFADSMQFFLPPAKNYIDLGSGAGFPGLIIACLLAEQKNSGKVDLIEANGKKCAFLREIVAALQLENYATIHNGRVENILPNLVNSSENYIIVARALASLDSLLHLTCCYITGETYGLFGKGKNYAKEIASAKKNWNFSCETIDSKTDSNGKLLLIKNVARAT